MTNWALFKRVWCYKRNVAPWWRHEMETFSALLAICAGNSPVPGEFPAQRPVMRSFDVFFDLRLNKRLSKQSWGWWFETPSRPLWRHRNAGIWVQWIICFNHLTLQEPSCRLYEAWSWSSFCPKTSYYCQAINSHSADYDVTYHVSTYFTYWWCQMRSRRLTQYGPVTTYGDIYVGHHWFR